MRVILHIGQHKTGSKALQSALYANRDHLAARRFAYPVAAAGAGPLRPYEMNHHALFAALRAAVDEREGPAAVAALRALLADLLAACPAGTETMILSAEDLFDMHTAHEAAFVPERVAAGARLLARELAARGCRPRLVCYLRRQDHLLAAHYAQFIKGSATHQLEFAEFHTLAADRLDADLSLARWEETFGREATTVAAYEPEEMPGGIVADFFRRALDLGPPPVTVPFPDDLEAFNVTPSRDHLDYMRLLNGRARRGRPVLAREQVLESAFRDRDVPAAGIAAWRSPAERVTLLARYEPGNRRIAARHGLAGPLFREPAPRDDGSWTPSPPLTLERLVELDTQARAAGAERAAVTGRRRGRAGLILWVVSPHAAAVDEAAACELLAAVVGCPGLESRCVRSVRCGTALASMGRVAFLVFVGPPAGGWSATLARWAVALGGGRVVRVPGPKPQRLLAV